MGLNYVPGAAVERKLDNGPWGVFQFYALQPGSTHGGRFGGYQVRCPFHEKNEGKRSGCRKTFKIEGPTGKDQNE